MAKRVRTKNGMRCQSAKGKFIKNSACGIGKKGKRRKRK